MTPGSVFEKVHALAPGRVWIVGGFLRDALLGRPSVDFDFAVAGDAESLARRFSQPLGKRPFALDAERGIYRVAAGEDQGGAFFDFCRLNGDSIEEDLSRRDFRVNAMALSPGNWGQGWARKVLDPHGGRRDLERRVVGLVNPKALQEDPLRLLRAFRFAAELGFSLAPATLTAIRAQRAAARRPAPERLREEILKTLDTPRGAAAFAAMDKAGVLAVLFPEVEPMRRTGRDYYGRQGVLGHSLKAMAEFEEMQGRLREYFPKFHAPLAAYLAEKIAGHPRFALLKLAELFHDVGKPGTAKVRKGKLTFYGHDALGGRMVEKIGQRLRFSSEETKCLSRLVFSHMRPGNLGNQPDLTERAIFRFYRDLGGDAVAMLLVSLADHFTYLSARVKKGKKDLVFLAIRRMLEGYFLKRETVEPPKILGGHDIMKALKLKPGPEVGRLLAAIKEAQAAGQVRDRAEGLAWAKAFVKKNPGPLSALKRPRPKPGTARGT